MMDPRMFGCWFCGGPCGEMLFSFEFDTFFHLDCLKAAIAPTDSIDEEAEIIAREFNLK